MFCNNLNNLLVSNKSDVYPVIAHKLIFEYCTVHNARRTRYVHTDAYPGHEELKLLETSIFFSFIQRQKVHFKVSFNIHSLQTSSGFTSLIITVIWHKIIPSCLLLSHRTRDTR